MKLGFIGLGSMGGLQAKELAKTSHDLIVFDVAQKAMAAFEGKAALAVSMADAGKDREIVGICVRDDKQVNECVDAVLPVMPAGSVILIHSTVKPATMIAIAERAAARKIYVLDAAVTRTSMTGDGPFVFCMTGGDEAIAQRVKPVMDAYATGTMHVGPLGAAMALKISNNLVSWSGILMGLEAARMAEAAGVPTEKLITVMNANGNMQPPMEAFINMRSKVLSDPNMAELMRSQSGIGEKDLSLAEALGVDVGAATPIASFAHGIIVEAVSNLSAYLPAPKPR